MTIDVTGVATTVTTTLVDTPPELAAISAVPRAFPVTTPAVVIMTMLVSALDQNTVAALMELPLVVFTCA